MVRQPRFDAAGLDFHVMDRGRGKSPVFIDTADFRFFLSRLAYAVRREEILVLAFVLMSNHFHLLLRSQGRLSEAMRRIKNEYVKHFNRRYGTDGALFRGRFTSKPVRNAHYRRNVILYFDENPLLARPALADSPESYVWSSAHRFARLRPTPWLSDLGIEASGLSYAGDAVKPSSRHARRVRKWFIEARLRHGEDGNEALADLLSGDLDRVRIWLLERTDPESERTLSLPVAGRETVMGVLGAHEEVCDAIVVALDRSYRQPSARLLSVGLLRDMAGLSFARIAAAVGRSRPAVRHLYEVHGRALREVSLYAALACRITALCVEPLGESG